METPVALALGSGSARGMAHFGVLRALRERGYAVAAVAGSSIGAIVGAAVAAGRAAELEHAYRSLDRKAVRALLDLVFPRSGLIEGERVTRFVLEHIGDHRVEDLALPFASVATELATGKRVVFRSGPVAEAIRASVSVPGFVVPSRVGDRLLIDGGMVDPVPVEVARELTGGELPVVAVDLNYTLLDGGSRRRLKLGRGESWLDSLRSPLARLDHPLARGLREWLAREPLPGMFEILLASADIMQHRIAQDRLRLFPPDVLIRPRLRDVRFLDYDRTPEIIAEGYRAACEALDSGPISRRSS